jgi:hypothetical protein
MSVAKHSWVIRRQFSHSSTRTLERQNTRGLEYLPDRRACRGPYFLRVDDGFEFIRFYDSLGNILCDSRPSLVRDLQVHILLSGGTDDLGHQGRAGTIPAAQCSLSLCPLSPPNPVMLRLVRLPFSYRCKSCCSAENTKGKSKISRDHHVTTISSGIQIWRGSDPDVKPEL